MKHHAWYSQKFVDLGFGTSWYRKYNSNDLIEVCVASPFTEKPFNYDDAVYLGEVGEWVKDGKPSKLRANHQKFNKCAV